jgi:hypothetical protein
MNRRLTSHRADEPSRRDAVCRSSGSLIIGAFRPAILGIRKKPSLSQSARARQRRKIEVPGQLGGGSPVRLEKQLHATLVERHPRYVMLAKVAEGGQ